MATDDELRQAMAAAMAGFAAVVGEVGPDDWLRDSPCEGWSVFDVVDHVIAGDRFAAIVLDGGTLDAAIGAVVGIDHVGGDAVGATTDAAAGARAGFAGPLDAEVEHPVGRIPARRFLGFRIMDQLGHTWDVATGIGRPVTLAPDAVAVALEVAATERAMLDASAHFAMPPEIDVDSSDPQSTFLRMIGRDPGANP